MIRALSLAIFLIRLVLAGLALTFALRWLILGYLAGRELSRMGPAPPPASGPRLPLDPSYPAAAARELRTRPLRGREQREAIAREREMGLPPLW